MLPDGKNVTLKDIAGQIGVSLRTVSLALKGEGRMAAATRNRILEIAHKLNYRPNIMARGLVNQKNYLLGIVLPYVTTSFYSEVLAGLEERCRENFYDLLLRNSGNDIQVESDAIERMLDRKVDGIICYPNPRAFDLYKRVVESGMPLVQIGRTVPLLCAPAVMVDDEHGMFIAVEKLISLGRKKIVYLSSGSGTPLMNVRRDGYRKALIRYGISLELNRYEVSCETCFESGYKNMKELLTSGLPVDAVAAGSDEIALGVIKACREAKRKVPEDIAVTGYDDVNIAYMQSQCALTTVAQPKKEIGFAAFDIFLQLQRRESAESVILPTTLVERDSA